MLCWANAVLNLTKPLIVTKPFAFRRCERFEDERSSTCHGPAESPQFFGDCGLRAGSIALATMGVNEVVRGASVADVERVHPNLPGLPHFPPKAKSIIYFI